MERSYLLRIDGKGIFVNCPSRASIIVPKMTPIASTSVQYSYLLVMNNEEILPIELNQSMSRGLSFCIPNAKNTGIPSHQNKALIKNTLFYDTNTRHTSYDTMYYDMNTHTSYETMFYYMNTHHTPYDTMFAYCLPRLQN